MDHITWESKHEGCRRWRWKRRPRRRRRRRSRPRACGRRCGRWGQLHFLMFRSNGWRHATDICKTTTNTSIRRDTATAPPLCRRVLWPWALFSPPMRTPSPWFSAPPSPLPPHPHLQITIYKYNIPTFLMHFELNNNYIYVFWTDLWAWVEIS